jgi:hypothetical protein
MSPSLPTSDPQWSRTRKVVPRKAAPEVARLSAELVSRSDDLWRAFSAGRVRRFAAGIIFGIDRTDGPAVAGKTFSDLEFCSMRLTRGRRVDFGDLDEQQFLGRDGSA